MWYDFLNMGFKLIPMAGSDFPYYNPPGVERNYVFVGDDDSIDAYYEALRNQRTFVTNGPMLEFEVNGALPGADLVLARGDDVVVEAHASLNPDIESIDRLELVVQGDVVATASNDSGDNRLSLFWTAKVLEGTWIAVRAYGVDQAVAHTAPVYVTTGGGFEKWPAVPDIARRMIAKLAEFEHLEADSTLELEAWSVGEPLMRMGRPAARGHPRAGGRSATGLHAYARRELGISRRRAPARMAFRTTRPFTSSPALIVPAASTTPTIPRVSFAARENAVFDSAPCSFAWISLMYLQGGLYSSTIRSQPGRKMQNRSFRQPGQLRNTGDTEVRADARRGDWPSTLIAAAMSPSSSTDTADHWRSFRRCEPSGCLSPSQHLRT